MELDSRQNLDFMSFPDHNNDLELLMDITLFGDSYMDELLAAVGSHSSPVPNFPDTEEGMGDDNGILSLQLAFHQFMPMNDPFQYGVTDPSFDLGNESYGTWDATTTPSVWSSSNTALSPRDNFLSISPPASLSHQPPEMSPHNDSQPESVGRSMPIPPVNHPVLPTQVQAPRRRRKRKDTDILKKDERKARKPEKCHICGIGHAQKRDLDRHMVSNHRKEAERLGLDVSKILCRVCKFEFDGIRRDRLVRHMKRKHPNSL
ncbi:hypothetical protein GGI35DRAFT_131579 [Trichoderma velutinum]